jgi:hypothetical protein
MHLYLSFEQGHVQGEGTDYVGPWVIRGQYDLIGGHVGWTKQYVGRHRVDYRGSITPQGIEGGWQIRGWNNGLFHIWPRNRFELENLYLQADLAGDGKSILAGTVPLPPADSL